MTKIEKTIVIMDKRGKRAPCVWAMYNYLRHEYNTFLCDGLDIGASTVCALAKKELGVSKIDGIIWGFQRGTGLEKSKDWLNRSEIPIIISVGDVWQFLERPHLTEQFWGLEHIKGIIYKQRLDTKEDPHLARLKALCKTGFTCVGATKDKHGTASETFLRNAEILMSPWALNHERIAEPDHDIKNIDVSHLATITPANNIHQTRVLHRESVLNLRKPLRTFTKNVYRRAYYDALRRSKILIVDASGSGLTTQKYIEGALHGCLLIGEVPYLDPLVFRQDCMVQCRPDEIEAKVKYYIKNEDMRRVMANDLRRRVINAYHLDASIDPIVELIK